MSAPPSLSELKHLIRDKYLGRFGIHGVGVRSSEQKIRIYASGNLEDHKEEFERIRTETAPYEIEVLFDEPPTLADTD